MHDKSRPLSSLLADLAGVVTDLYGGNAASLGKLTEEVQSAPALEPVAGQQPAVPAAQADLSALPDLSGIFAASARPGVPAPATAPAQPARPVHPALPPFDALWKTADEAIDWTEALASSTPTDGLTPQDKWDLYHEQAACVLHGDVSAYLKVLKAANPMADLMPFVTSLDVSARSSDDLQAVFAARPDLLETEPKHYLCGMALRIARDLFAVLPVTRVTVNGRHGDSELLTVEFSRQELNKVRFAFIDPVDFVTRCGGVFPEQPA